jgi:hypothetical protein
VQERNRDKATYRLDRIRIRFEVDRDLSETLAILAERRRKKRDRVQAGVSDAI